MEKLLKKNIGIIGGGSFGTAMANMLAHNGHQVHIWTNTPDIAHNINKKHKNPCYLTHIKLHSSIWASHSIKDVCLSKKVIFLAVPSHVLPTIAKNIKPHLTNDIIIVNLSKGLDTDTKKRISEILYDIFVPIIPQSNICVISGPSHAEEVGNMKPCSVVVAGYDKQKALYIQHLFSNILFRIYYNEDIIGVELGGILKNIYAIASGIIDGIELGDNARAALLTRSMVEMQLYGTKKGAKPNTFYGLSGMGDLIVTCNSKYSRNKHVGYQIGKGKNLEEILNSMNMVAEGIKTTKIIYEITRSMNISMPIMESIYNILFNQAEPKTIIKQLMSRSLKTEF